MTIFVCLCGKTKTGQPYNSANRHKWVCPQCRETELAPLIGTGDYNNKSMGIDSARGGMVDARDLKSLASGRRGGSSPSGRTNEYATTIRRHS